MFFLANRFFSRIAPPRILDKTSLPSAPRFHRRPRDCPKFFRWICPPFRLLLFPAFLAQRTNISWRGFGASFLAFGRQLREGGAIDRLPGPDTNCCRPAGKICRRGDYDARLLGRVDGVSDRSFARSSQISENILPGKMFRGRRLPSEIFAFMRAGRRGTCRRIFFDARRLCRPKQHDYRRRDAERLSCSASYGSRKTQRPRALNDGGAFVVDAGGTPAESMFTRALMDSCRGQFSGGFLNLTA